MNSPLASGCHDSRVSLMHGTTNMAQFKGLKPKMRRTKTGCLCCRKRRKKCDERYPNCQGCKRNRINCVWPVGRDEILRAPLSQQRLVFERFKHENNEILRTLDVNTKQLMHPVFKDSDFLNVNENVMTNAHHDDLGTFVVSVVKSDFFSNNKGYLNGEANTNGPCSRGVRKMEKLKAENTEDLENEQDLEETVDSATEVSTPNGSPADLEDKLVALPSDTDSTLEITEAGESLSDSTIVKTYSKDNSDSIVKSYAGLDPYVELTLNKFKNWIPNVTLSTDDAFLYHLFVTQYIPLVSPLHSHPLLSPAAICIPQVIYSPVVREVFLGSGAVYLGNKIPELKAVALRRRSKVVALLQETVNDPLVRGDEDWVLVLILMFWLLERFSGMSPTSLASHIGSFYKIWKKRLMLREKENQFMGFVLGGMFDMDLRKPFNASPLERNLVEGFIFNYSVTILMCQHEELRRNLPSPFEIFETHFFPDLKSPIYDDCVIPWMNNPIVGSALDSFIFAAKLSWLCRLHLPLQEENYWRCSKLKRDLDSLKIETVPEHLRCADNYFLLKNNVSVAVIIAQLASILVEKMLDPTLASSSPVIQEKVKIIISELIAISSSTSECCLPFWGVMVAGSAAIDQYRLEYFQLTIRSMARAQNSNVSKFVNNYLSRVWSLNAQTPGLGFEAIFDTIQMDSMVV